MRARAKRRGATAASGERSRRPHLLRRPRRGLRQAPREGRRVAVSGRLEHDQWQTGDDSRRQRHYVVADAVEFLDQKPVGVEAVADADDEPEAKPKGGKRAARP